MVALAWTRRPISLTALVAVAVLLVHAVVMGWHVPPQLRALAGLDSGVCHSETTGHESPDQPAAPGDHLAHCPVCLSLDGGKLLGPIAGPALAPPSRVVALSFVPAGPSAFVAAVTPSYSARAPPTVV